MGSAIDSLMFYLSNFNGGESVPGAGFQSQQRRVSRNEKARIKDEFVPRNAGEVMESS